MLRGVNHQIIEIRQTQDPYFERALLFVRPDCASEPPEQLRREGERFLSAAKPFTGLQKARLHERVKQCALLLSGGLGGALLGLFFSKMG